MLKVIRWVAIGFCLLNLVPLLSERGGLGEYLHGASLTTARLDSCVERIDQLERPHTTCSARWTVGAKAMTGTVVDVDSTGWKPADSSLPRPYPVQIPDTARQATVFAHGAEARPAHPGRIAVGVGFLAVLVGLLAWSAVCALRRIAGRRHAPAIGATTAVG